MDEVRSVLPPSSTPSILSTALPLLGALLAIVLWGISFVATKAALAEMSPLTLIFTRFAIGSFVLLLMVSARGMNPWPARDSLGPLLAMGFIGVFVHQMLQAWGLTMTSAINTGWLVGLTPIWSAVLAALFLHERFTPMKLTGLMIAFIGATIVMTRGEIKATTLSLPSTRGDLLILASTFNWAIYTILGHRTIRRLGPSRATTGSVLLGTLMLTPGFVAQRGWEEVASASSQTLGAVLFLGVACSALGYLLWYAALERVEATRVASLLYLEPLVTLGAAMWLLGEPFRPATAVGGLLVLAGVVLVQRVAPRRAEVPPAPLAVE
ncbi:MAG TPA: DMT family transporter [Thermoanaerobaculia bacterium]|nr:DMT family transporter [Thermoanaerobaculia bacterium]